VLRRFLTVWLIVPVFLPPALRGVQTESARAHLERGAAHLQRSQPREAIVELKRAVAIDPRSAAAHQLLGQAYLGLGAVEMIGEARAEFQQALDLDPGLVWARFYLAKINFDLGRLEKAKAELERALQTRPNVPHFLSLLGEVSRQLGQPERAVELSRKALEADPAMTPAHYYIALAYLDLKNEDEAIRELERAVGSKYVIPEMYLKLGSIHTAKGNLAEAEQLYQKAVALDPARPEAHLRLAEVYRLQGAHDPALEQLKRAAPDGKRFLNTEYFQKLQADYFYETGRVYEDKGMVEEAAKAYMRALEVEPGHEPAQRQLAALRKRQ
jgi:tetratricopeptide (TPR) repeat protein